MNRYYFTGFFLRDRSIGINEIRSIANRFGYILDHRSCSDLSISMTIETKERKIHGLYRAFSGIMNMERSGSADQIG